MNNQHAGLSQVLAEQRITEQRQQAAHARLVRGARSPRRRHQRWADRGWRQLARWPGVAAEQPACPRSHAGWFGETAAHLNQHAWRSMGPTGAAPGAAAVPAATWPDRPGGRLAVDLGRLLVGRGDLVLEASQGCGWPDPRPCGDPLEGREL